MDRTIVYPGALPQDTDILSGQTNAMTGLGYALRAVFGTAAFVDGLVVAPTNPASMSVSVSEGSISQIAQVDSGAFGSVPAMLDPVVKMGINTKALLLNLASPLTVGQSQVFLVQVAFDEHDDTPIVMPYYNAAQPLVAFAGPGNTNVPQNTRRAQRALISVKPGVPATSGTQVTPPADVGYFPLYAITLANGQTTVIAGSIVLHPQSPALPFKLPSVGPTIAQAQAWNTPGTFTFLVPNYVRQIEVEIVGAGGSGGGTSDVNYPGGGGGGGGFCWGVLQVTPGSTVSGVIGVGGSAGNPGGVTSFGSMSASGGISGVAGATGLAGTGGGGGTGTGGTLNNRGSAGSQAIVNTTAMCEGGTGGMAYKGAGVVRAAAGYGTLWDGGPGNSPGGGSTGCTRTPGAGGNGQVLIKW